MGQTPNTKSNELGMYVYLSSQDGNGFGAYMYLFCRRWQPCLQATYPLEPNPIEIQPSTLAQPIPMDSDGDMDIDLLGLAPALGGRPALTLWHNTWDPANSNSQPFEQCAILRSHVSLNIGI